MSTAVMPFEVSSVMKASDYWRKVQYARDLLRKHYKREDLNPHEPFFDGLPWIHITALDNSISLLQTKERPLRTFECSWENAAVRISERTHRLASDDEIETFKQDRLDREAQCRAEDERLHPERAAQRASTMATVALTQAAKAMTSNAEKEEKKSSRRGDQQIEDIKSR